MTFQEALDHLKQNMGIKTKGVRRQSWYPDTWVYLWKAHPDGEYAELSIQQIYPDKEGWLGMTKLVSAVEILATDWELYEVKL